MCVHTTLYAYTQFTCLRIHQTTIAHTPYTHTSHVTILTFPCTYRVINSCAMHPGVFWQLLLLNDSFFMVIIRRMFVPCVCVCVCACLCVCVCVHGIIVYTIVSKFTYLESNLFQSTRLNRSTSSQTCNSHRFYKMEYKWLQQLKGNPSNWNV